MPPALPSPCPTSPSSIPPLAPAPTSLIAPEAPTAPTAPQCLLSVLLCPLAAPRSSLRLFLVPKSFVPPSSLLLPAALSLCKAPPLPVSSPSPSPSLPFSSFPLSPLLLRPCSPSIFLSFLAAAARSRPLPRAMDPVADIRPGDSPTEPSGWKIKMLYDGDCPLCMREVNMLRERNKRYGNTINFVDICADDYAAEENSNIGFETAMGRIHAIRHDGEVLTNVAAFRALYEEVGLGWVYAISRYEPWASIVDTVYEFWAKYRLPITGRPPLAEVLERRRQRKVQGGKSSADEKRCQLE